MNKKGGNANNLERVNSSGFPLQLGLERLIKDNEGEHGWHFLSKEHPWKNQELDSGGYIDLIIENQFKNQVMVFECKRVRDTACLFLIPTKEVEHERVVNAWFYSDGKKVESFFNWKNLAVDPISPVSEFCVMSDKNRPMLEKTAAELINATQALANEEYDLKMSEKESLRIYFSVIVTTAELKVCNFDLSDIDIKSGEIDDANFSNVPFIRFRKSLSIHTPKTSNFKNINEIDKATERTVFIVNSAFLQDFLKSFKVDLQSSHFL